MRFFTVDAFTERPFTGNPAAVVLCDQTLEEDSLQAIAVEFNLSETAYLRRKNETASWNAEKRFQLRWFTPTNEVALCGHATLASAHVLFTCMGNRNEVLEFETLSGVLLARREGSKVVLDFPSNEPRRITSEEQKSLARIISVASGGCPVEEVMLSTTAKKLMIRLKDTCSRSDLESLRVDHEHLMSMHDGSIFKGVIITLKGTCNKEGLEDDKGLSEYHFVSRYFSPWNGIPEDPVTGSAHTVLCPYWKKVFDIEPLKCRQCSKRGGDLMVSLTNESRVIITGCATTVFEGSINLPDIE